MIKPRRVGHATFETPDMERMIDYYTEVVGLVLAEREKDRAYLASKVGLLTIQINKGAAERCTTLSFEVAPNSDFGELARELEKGRHQERAAQRFHARHRPGARRLRTTRAPPSRCSRSGAISASICSITASDRSNSAISPSWSRTRRRRRSSTPRCSAFAFPTGSTISSSSCAAIPITTPSISSAAAPSSCITWRSS